MPSFGTRLDEFRRDMGLMQVDLAQITGKSTQRINAYVSRGETPTFHDLLSAAASLGLSLDWLAGVSDHPRWSSEVMGIRVWLRTQAATLPEANVHPRMLHLIQLIRARLPIARESWFIPGLLGLHAGGMVANGARYQEFEAGLGLTPTVLRTAMERLAEFTGLSPVWIQLGHASDLAPVVVGDLGAWAQVVERYHALGHTPQQHTQWAAEVDRLLRTYPQE